MSRESIFDAVGYSKPSYNTFDMSHSVKLSAKMGKLIPVSVIEVLPGDSFTMHTEQLVRLAPMLAPMMQKVDIYMHHWFCPNDLLWDRWSEFITGGDDGFAAPAMPYVKAGEIEHNVESIIDYFGIPTDVTLQNSEHYNAFPFAAYNLIWNEHYRDQNLQDPKDYKLSSGDNTSMLYATGVFGEPYRRAWAHDKFTSALPEPMKGPDVLVPIGGLASLYFERDLTDETNGTRVWRSRNTPSPGGIGGVGDSDRLDEGTLNIDTAVGTGSSTGSDYTYMVDNNSNVTQVDVSRNHYVDLSSATSATMADLRYAARLLEVYEKNMRAGSRIKEWTKAHFNVDVPDYRIQRPVYLGGGTSPIVVSEVLQTSQTTDSSPQGNMSGHGVNFGFSKQFSQSFVQHGHIISIMSIMPEASYHQGLHKMWSRNEKFDFSLPAFAQLGEQPILNKEVYLDGDPDQDSATWGFEPRYADMRFLPNRIAGQFKTTLKHWHMGREFASLPALNSDFIECTPTSRVFADTTDSSHCYVALAHVIKARRALPLFNVPQL